jgi:hypothetical protein
LKTSAQQSTRESVRILRIIARLNIGGPAIQAITLTKRLEEYGYRTMLVRGCEEPDEGNMDQLAHDLGVQPVRVSSLRRNPGWHDITALLGLIRLIWRERPDIVHTHAAKAGTHRSGSGVDSARPRWTPSGTHSHVPRSLFDGILLALDRRVVPPN